jgi:hypothetical protein
VRTHRRCRRGQFLPWEAPGCASDKCVEGDRNLARLLQDHVGLHGEEHGLLRAERVLGQGETDDMV